MTTVLITGATSGIGRSMAFEFAKRGYRLILVARNQQALCTLAKKLNTKVKVLALDLSKPENCFLLHKKTKGINIDILVNNAGFGAFGEFYKTDLNNELNLIDLNIKAVHILTKLYLRDFREKKQRLYIEYCLSCWLLCRSSYVNLLCKQSLCFKTYTVNKARA